MNRRLGNAILAILLILVGVVWLLQGVGVLGGSPMTGVTMWAWIGGASLLAGAWWAFRIWRG